MSDKRENPGANRGRATLSDRLGKAARDHPDWPGPGWVAVWKTYTNGSDQIVGWTEEDPRNPGAIYTA